MFVSRTKAGECINHSNNNHLANNNSNNNNNNNRSPSDEVLFNNNNLLFHIFNYNNQSRKDLLNWGSVCVKWRMITQDIPLREDIELDWFTQWHLRFRYIHMKYIILIITITEYGFDLSLFCIHFLSILPSIYLSVLIDFPNPLK